LFAKHERAEWSKKWISQCRRIRSPPVHQNCICEISAVILCLLPSTCSVSDGVEKFRLIIFDMRPPAAVVKAFAIHFPLTTSFPCCCFLLLPFVLRYFFSSHFLIFSFCSILFRILFNFLFCLRNQAEDLCKLQYPSLREALKLGRTVWPIFIKCVIWELYGARGGTVGWGTALQTGRSQFRFPMVSQEFFIGIILSVALWPWGRLSL
jgi:hypothetical protein